MENFERKPCTRFLGFCRQSQKCEINDNQVNIKHRHELSLQEFVAPPKKKATKRNRYEQI